MSRRLASSIVALAALAAAAPRASAQQPAAPATVSMMGVVAPDFTAPVQMKGAVSPKPFKLSDYKGQTVVLAFYPKARTQGCTIQMEAYRDKYASLFKDGKQVVLVGVSADADTTLAAWATEKGFQFRLVSDMDGAVARSYATWNEQNKVASRHLIMVGPDGKIVFEQRPFRVTAQEAYTLLGEAVEKSMKGGGN